MMSRRSNTKDFSPPSLARQNATLGQGGHELTRVDTERQEHLVLLVVCTAKLSSKDREWKKDHKGNQSQPSGRPALKK